ncbi:RNA 2',3'-cyclic phosphodiesterase [Candidatus Woesearchaeota archaeon]|nr:RNA 2',3'-cyclic phosphodiesterase [Candidatus Woesearchaeota archaeon]
MRLFVGVPIAEEIKAEIIKFQNELVRLGADVKLVEPQNLHFTLKFLGDANRDTIERVILDLKKIELKKFAAEIQGVGIFPSERTPRVVWVGIKENKRFVSLAEDMQEKLKDVRKEDHDHIVLHLTVARVKPAKNLARLLSLIKLFQGKYFGELEINRFVLYQSILTAHGPSYTVVEEFKATDL